MSEIIKPIILDQTGQQIVEQLNIIAQKIGGRTKLYGIHINGNESDPASMVTYLEDAVGMTPAHMDYTNDRFDYGSWGDAWFIKNVKPCILNANGTVYAYLNPNNYAEDVDGNDMSGIIDGTTDFGQNVMIEFPKIWMKIVPTQGDDKSGDVYVSPVKLDDDFYDFPYIDSNGRHKEHFYMPAFNGTNTNNIIRSLHNKQISKSLNAQTEVTRCKANGAGWNTEDAGEVMWINFLLMLIGKSTDTQTVFGQGIHTGGYETINDGFRTGIHTNKGLFYGTNSGTANVYTNAVKVFGIENWWGLQWRRYAGDINNNGTRKVKLCYGMEDGSTVHDFNFDGTDYVTIGVTPSGTSGGYINEMKFTKFGMFSSVSNGSSTTYYCDGQWFNNGRISYALRGGNSGSSSSVGAFLVSLDDTAAGAGWNRGASPSYK